MKEFASYRFSAINVKRQVASRFRKFSRLVAHSHTATLEAMMNFFEWNDLSPNDDLGFKNNRTTRRINALIAVVKNIEKHQTLPTRAMMDTLFQEVSKIEAEEEDKMDFTTPTLLTESEELAFYRNQYEEIQSREAQLKRETAAVLDRMIWVKGTFGGGYWRLEMEHRAFDTLKNRLADVYNDHPAEN